MPELPTGDVSSVTAATSSPASSWEARIADCVRDATARLGSTPYLLTDGSESRFGSVITDWTAYPRRVGVCVGSTAAGRLLDWHTSTGDEGRRRFQEEYGEWRLTRDANGRIVRFELTTELPEYWEWLAGTDPARTLELVEIFAGGHAVDAADVYGTLDPFDTALEAPAREKAFAQNLLGTGTSPYNNGVRAICCMRQPSNTLSALVSLATAAARPRVVHETETGDARAANAAEIIPLLANAAEAGRNSDPVIVEHLARLTLEGRFVAFDGSPAVHVRGVQLDRLIAPDGQPAPAEWFSLQRVTSADSDPVTLGQRLTLEVPSGEGYVIGELRDAATGRLITTGAQIAELVQLVLCLRASGAGELSSGAEIIGGGAEHQHGDGAFCDAVRKAWGELCAAGGGAARS
jgi:hypothetical protein